MDGDNNDLEPFDDFFGRTPLQTPFGSQDSSLSCAIDLSDGEGNDEVFPDLDINERVRQYLLENQTSCGISDGDGSEPDNNGDGRQDAERVEDNVTAEVSGDEDLLRVKKLKQDGCDCSLGCPSNFSEADMIDHIRNVREMDKSDKDMYIMGTLISYDTDTTIKGKKRKRCRNKHMFRGQAVCRNFFLVVYAIGRKGLKNLLKHMDKHGAVPRVHGNIGKKRAHGLVFDDIKAVVQFIINYADTQGLPQPAATRASDNTPPIYLHCQTTKKAIHQEYLDAVGDTFRSIRYTTFVKIWRSCVPHIRIASPRDDVCATCEKLRKKISDARTEEEKLTTTADYRDHVISAQLERDLYNKCIDQAMNGNEDGTNYCHVTFDYCQNVTIPHHGRQMGPLYFTTPRKIHIFGVRIDGIPRQLNFLLDEHETIGKDGSLTHGPNAVISMLDWVLENYSRDESSIALHADNCPGQNKNQFVLGYFMWRVMTGRQTQIEYMMQIPGHARCRVDGGFGRIKQLYRRTDCDTIDQLEDVVNRSAGSNEAVRFPAWQWRDWKGFLGRIFRPVKGIRSFQSFKFAANAPGVVTVRREYGGTESTIRMLRSSDNAVFGDAVPDLMCCCPQACRERGRLTCTVWFANMYDQRTRM